VTVFTGHAVHAVAPVVAEYGQCRPLLREHYPRNSLPALLALTHSRVLRISEWIGGDACSLGRNGEQYFLLLVDKTTEYYVTFNTITWETPVSLLK